MKQLIQSYKTGELGLFEIPEPICGKNGILINTTASLVSAGTEKMIVDIAKKSLLGKAKARPDLVKQVIEKMKQEGIMNTLEKVFNKLDTPIPLGYSCAGNVMEIGKNISGISIGDRVACGGAGYANHSEVNYIPKNLFVKVPDNVDDIGASFVTVGAIALQGVRQACPAIGEIIAVIGLGLIGQLTIQILKANGCKVLGIDIDDNKLKLAKELGADVVCKSEEIISTALQFSNGYGVDISIITASTTSNQPIIDAGEITRIKGKVVVVGMVGMDIPRNIYYKKELDVRLSMAYGPGRYDTNYEQKGIDYPYGYVRWTEQRNFIAFLDLISSKSINIKSLITHRFKFYDAMNAYQLIQDNLEPYLTIVFEYPHSVNQDGRLKGRTVILNSKIFSYSRQDVVVGFIGAGNYASLILLPAIKKAGVKLKTIASLTGISGTKLGQKFGFEKSTTSINEIIDNPEINTVIIATRHDSHADLVLSALGAGKHVFVEKPLCISIDELDKIEAAYSKIRNQNLKPPLLMVGFNRRFSLLIQKMKTLLDGMKEPKSMVMMVNAGKIPFEHWTQDPKVGGGRIIGEACHFIDLLMYLTMSKVHKVSIDKIKGVSDTVSIQMSFVDGSIATIHYFANGCKDFPKERLEIFCGEKILQLDNFRTLRGWGWKNFTRNKLWSQDKGQVNSVKAFFEAIHAGGEPPIPIEEIFDVTRITLDLSQQ